MEDNRKVTDNIYTLSYELEEDNILLEHIFYVGHSCDLDRRMGEHRLDGRTNRTVKGQFINKLERVGIKWRQKVVHRIYDNEIVRNYEEWYVIKYIREGHQLTNMKMGDIIQKACKPFIKNKEVVDLETYIREKTKREKMSEIDKKIYDAECIEKVYTKAMQQQDALVRVENHITNVIRDMVEYPTKYEVQHWSPKLDQTKSFPVVMFKGIHVFLGYQTVLISYQEQGKFKIGKDKVNTKNVGRMLLDKLTDEDLIRKLINI